MRVIVTAERRTDAGEPHWFVRVDVPGTSVLDRVMPAHRDDAGRWWPSSLPDGPEQPDALVRLTLRLAVGTDVDLATIREYGRFLLLALIGDKGWELVRGRDTDGHPDELELRFPSDDADLHRLMWELLHAPDEGGEFLAQDQRRPVLILRGVAMRGRSDRVIAPVTAVPRMLFAVGSELHDTEVRAGTEVMSIIRGYDRSCSLIDFRVRSRVTLDELERACREIRPHLVHVIAHGSFQPDPEPGNNTVELRAEPDMLGRSTDADGQALRHEVHDVGARELIGALRAAGDLPLMILLSACESGSTQPGGSAIAADLVAAGIPIVVSMTGPISNAACRVFARAFATAVVHGMPLHHATAEARQLTFSRLSGGDVDWARPVIFAASDVPPAFRVVDDRDTQRLRQFLSRLGPVSSPVLYARDEFFDFLDHLLDPDDRLAVLLAEGPSATARPGGTRLLRELAGAALRSGNVPCNVTFAPGKEPKNAAQLAVDVLCAIGVTRSELDLDVRFGSAVLAGIEDELGKEKVDGLLPSRHQHTVARAKRLRPALESQPVPEGFVDELAAWIRRDLLDLAAAARQTHSGLFAAAGRPLLLLDNPQAVPNLFSHLDALFSMRGVSAEGVEQHHREKVPVVVFSKDPKLRSSGLESRLTRALQEQAWARTAEVRLFHKMAARGYENFEATAWRWLVMHPLPTANGYTRPLTVVAGQDEKWARIVRQQTADSEEIYSNTLMTAITEAGAAQSVLEEDNHDAALEYWQDSRGAA